MRAIAHRVAQALSEYRTKASTWLMTRLSSRVQASRNGWPFDNRGSPMKKPY